MIMNMYKIVLIVLLLSLLAACKREEFIYVDSSYEINGYTIYFREYQNSEDCLNEDYYIVYPDNIASEYIAIESVKSLDETCSSTYYIEYEIGTEETFGFGGLGLEEHDGYIVLYHAYGLELFSLSDIKEFADQFTIYRVSMD